MKSTTGIHVVLLIAAVIATYAFVIGERPPRNPLLPAAGADEAEVAKNMKANAEIVAAQNSYSTFLGSMLIAAIAGNVAALFAMQNHHSECRAFAITSIAGFSIAIAFVTCGFAIRVFWRMGGNALPEWLVFFDYYIAGPLTAIACMIGLYSLVRMAICALKGGNSGVAHHPIP